MTEVFTSLLSPFRAIRSASASVLEFDNDSVLELLGKSLILPFQLFFVRNQTSDSGTLQRTWQDYRAGYEEQRESYLCFWSSCPSTPQV
jgi:hypothetical protein